MSILVSPAIQRRATLGSPESWVDHHGDALLRYALARVVDRSIAEDLVQETLLSAWRGREAFDGGCEPRTWLVAILKRRIADHYRRQGRRRETPSDGHLEAAVSEEKPAGPECEAAEFWAVVSRCAGDLPEHLSRAFRLRTFGEAAPEAICDSEGISRKNLSVRLHRARQLLRRCLESKWFDNE